jgi:hypothetical protein
VLLLLRCSRLQTVLRVCITLCAQHAATASQSNVVVVAQMRKARTNVSSCFDRTTANITTLLC